MANTNASSKKHQEPNIVWFNKSANLNNPDFYSYMKKLESTENLGITLSKKLFKCGWTSNSWLEDKKKKRIFKNHTQEPVFAYSLLHLLQNC